MNKQKHERTSCLDYRSEHRDRPMGGGLLAECGAVVAINYNRNRQGAEETLKMVEAARQPGHHCSG
ncbi:MAG: hypothetical protein IPO77_00505 [Acidobacteria bacterium]|nr:hypothetical protein [Acidobacteriota bacterium]